MPGPVVLDHDNGRRIKLMGNRERPENVVLNFPNTDGLHVVDGAQWGMISGFRLVNTSGAAGGIALQANAGASASFDALVIEGFYLGLYSSHGNLRRVADVAGTYLKLEGNRYSIVAAYNGHIQADGVDVTDTEKCLDSTERSYVRAMGGSCRNSTGEGFVASEGSFVRADGARSENTSRGFFASAGSMMRIPNATVFASVTDGVVAERGSTVMALGMTIDGAGAWGLAASTNSAVDISGATVRNSALGGVKSSTGATVVAAGVNVSNNGPAPGSNHFSPARVGGDNVPGTITQ